MQQNAFLKSLKLPPLAHIPRGETVEDIAIYQDSSIAYHGSPFSPKQMAEVFERHGHPPLTWALLPLQPRRLNSEGVVKSYGEGASVSAGTAYSALTRAFLH